MFTLNELTEMFPRENIAYGVTTWIPTYFVTGYIPMQFVNANLSAIAKLVKANKLRRIYRGPCRYTTSNTTHREDAHSMLLCLKVYKGIDTLSRCAIIRT